MMKPPRNLSGYAAMLTDDLPDLTNLTYNSNLTLLIMGGQELGARGTDLRQSCP